MRALGGTYGFLFTDVEGSTRLWEERRSAMSEAIARHDEIVRRAAEEAGGRVFKGLGDGACAVFPSASASAAASAAVRAQRALVREPWPEGCALRVRMAVHCGEAQERGGDYFGPALNRVGRLLAVAHGGQILLSEAVASEVQRPLLELGVTLEALGEHLLRGLERPERVSAAAGDGLPAGFPPLNSAVELRVKLPAETTSFVGRERERAEVRRRLEAGRLVTLAGPGGAGKTRLAVHAARESAEEFPDGVFLVELAPLGDPALVAATALLVLELPEDPKRGARETLLAHLARRRTLLVLDNCEHLLDACAELVAEILRRSEGVRVLATSRTPLALAGESVVRVGSLATPSSEGTATLAAVAKFDSVRLFVERARQVRPDWSPSEGDAADLARICARLDGIPLAIELAAARTRAMPLATLAARLDDRFRLLTGGSRDLLPRQRTLRALVDWSYDLLDEGDRALLRRLAVFAGSWILESAEAVVAGEGLSPATEAWEVADGLERLVDRSLVGFDPFGGRYTLLETIRGYGRERLEEAGEAALLRARHRAWCAGLLASANPGDKDDVARVASERDDIRAALDGCERDADGEVRDQEVAILSHYRAFLRAEGRWTESLAWIGAALARPDRPRTREVGRLIIARGEWALRSDDFDAGEAMAAEALALGAEIGDARLRSFALNLRSLASSLRGDLDAAVGWARESVESVRGSEDDLALTLALTNLGESLLNADANSEAIETLADALARATAMKHDLLVCLARVPLAIAEADRGRLAVAADHAAAALLYGLDRNQPLYAAVSATALARTLPPADGARLAGAAARLRAEVETPPERSEERSARRALDALRESLGPAEFDRKFAEGRGLSFADAAAFARELAHGSVPGEDRVG